MSWPALIRKNLLRRPARTALTAAGVGLGVGLIVALLGGSRRCANARRARPSCWSRSDSPVAPWR
ncbi:MAG: hypothetical protein ABR569_06500, partial [Gaiellaceae bacterium]